MFIGHYAVALAANRAAPRASLGALFAATSLADLLWPVFLLLGWEQAHIVPGPNPFLTLWLDSIPISHSLITLIGWGASFGLVYRARTADGRGGVVIALLVVSHWVLDFATHRPDMPLYPGGRGLGLGLWNSVSGTVVTESVMFAAGLWLYAAGTRARDGVVAMRGQPDSALAQRADDVRSLQRMIRLCGVLGREADDGGAVRIVGG